MAHFIKVINISDGLVAIRTDNTDDYNAMRHAFANTHIYHHLFNTDNDSVDLFITYKDNISELNDWLWNNEKIELKTNNEEL